MRAGLEHAANLIKQDAYTICNAYGEDAIISEVMQDIKDSYGTIVGRDIKAYTIRVYPVIDNPTQKQIEAGGLREVHECMVYMPTLALEKNNIDPMKLLNTMINIRGKQYRISEIKEDSKLCDKPIYYVIGLSRQ